MSHPFILRTPGFPGPAYRAITPPKETDEEISVLIRPSLVRFATSHGAANVPPMPLLIAAYKHAWSHYLGPRRKKYNPALTAMEWALVEINRLLQCWVSRRPDIHGAWKQHEHLATWAQRVVKSSVEIPAVVTQENTAPPVNTPAGILQKGAKPSAADEDKILSALAEGISQREVAQRFGISQATVSRMVKRSAA